MSRIILYISILLIIAIIFTVLEEYIKKPKGQRKYTAVILAMIVLILVQVIGNLSSNVIIDNNANSSSIDVNQQATNEDVKITVANDDTSSTESAALSKENDIPMGDKPPIVSISAAPKNNNDNKDKTSPTTTINTTENSKILTIDKITEVSDTNITPASILTFTGSINSENQIDEYTFVPETDGKYRFELSGINADTNMYLQLYDSFGDQKRSTNVSSNDEGFSYDDFNLGETYTVRVKQNSGFGSYTLSIGQPKPVKDISGYTSVQDSIEFKNQENNYSFVVPREGNYRFDLSGINADTDMYLQLFDSLGYQKNSISINSASGGFHYEHLTPGETYIIKVKQDSGLDNYTLSIGAPKEVKDVSEYNTIKDSIEYTDQINCYSYKAPRDGKYRFEISEKNADTCLYLKLFDSLGYQKDSKTVFMNSDGLSSNLVGGEIYTITVKQYDDFGDYTLSISSE